MSSVPRCVVAIVDLSDLCASGSCCCPDPSSPPSSLPLSLCFRTLRILHSAMCGSPTAAIDGAPKMAVIGVASGKMAEFLFLAAVPSQAPLPADPSSGGGSGPGSAASVFQSLLHFRQFDGFERAVRDNAATLVRHHNSSTATEEEEEERAGGRGVDVSSVMPAAVLAALAFINSHNSTATATTTSAEGSRSVLLIFKPSPTSLEGGTVPADVAFSVAASACVEQQVEVFGFGANEESFLDERLRALCCATGGFSCPSCGAIDPHLMAEIIDGNAALQKGNLSAYVVKPLCMETGAPIESLQCHIDVKSGFIVK